MCGIVGCILKKGEIQQSQLGQSVQAIYHRGPDEQSTWISEDRKIALGHTRLSINDIENGHQPLYSSNKSIFAIINGEFYNHNEIKKNLEKKGHIFKTTCDSEIIIPLYQEYGMQCLDYLRGEFAFALYDKNKNQIFLVRDRFGIKPLYFTLYKDNLYFASEIKALMPFGINMVWDPNSILMMNHAIYPQDKTCFKNIFSVKPGHYLAGTASGIQQHCYWDLDYSKNNSIKSRLSSADYIQEFKSRLEEAVKIRLQSDLPVACYLSGGIDSSTILGLASSLSSKKIDAFNLTFEDEIFDESIIAKEMAHHAGANYNEVKVTNSDVLNYFSDSVFHSESVVMNSHGVSLFLLSRAVHKAGYKSVLTGGGADETLAGYSFFKEDLISRTNKKLLKDAESLQASVIGAGILSATEQNLVSLHDVSPLSFIPYLLKIYASRYSKFSSLYSNDYANFSKKISMSKNFIHSLIPDKINNLGILNTSSYLFCISTLPGYILSTVGDRMEMAHSVEGRVPFLDHRLFDFVKMLPDNMKINDYIEKYILREAAKNIVTETLYFRTKQPFFAPPLVGVLGEMMDDIFNSRILKDLPFFNQKKVLNLLRNISTLNKRDLIEVDSLLTEILSICILQMRFNVSSDFAPTFSRAEDLA